LREKLQEEEMVTKALQSLRDSEASGLMADEAREGQISIMLGHALQVGLHSLRWETVRDFGREDTISV